MDMGKQKRNSNLRNVNGILLLDKPSGLTSNAALQQVKRLYRARKAGHTGSLDPLATGLLPICFGEATKISGFLLDADKHYLVRCQLGVKTTTGDAEGEVIEQRPVVGIDAARLRQVLTGFLGKIDQIPPMYSALKHKGERLYKLARQGVEVERVARTVTIHALELLGLEGTCAELRVHCSKGTYVRTLAEDMGEVLGCGAYITALRRTSVGPYAGKEMITLEQLQLLAEQGTDHLDAQLMPLDTGLMNWPAVELDANSAFYIKQGQPVLVAKSPVSGLVRIYDQSRFLGVGEIQDDGKVAPRRLMLSV